MSSVINAILQDTTTYRKLPANVDSKIFKKVKDFTTQFSHCFDKNGKENMIWNSRPFKVRKVNLKKR